MSAWLVRPEGSSTAVTVPTAGDVLSGLRDGNWLPNDEVKGPADPAWQSIETHPIFKDVAAEIEPPRPEAADETTLDMNPLIDVCLVLLIFFILTITYASLERTVSIPDDTPDKQGPAPVMQYKDIKDQVFLVTAKMEGDRVVIKIEKEEVAQDQIAGKIQQIIDQTGRREMIVDIDKDVPWGVETAILDAAKGKGIHNIINNYRGK